MAIQQNDIKRILAYSTISQLGYMVLGVAVGPVWGIPMFHLFTHAFFKCLLFLCAGSVIVGMHHKQDIWEMGGLAKKMPITFLAMVIGTLALIGCPFFAGSFSKDLIIEYALGKSMLWYWISAGAVVLTAAYMTRLIVVVFFGAPRTDHARKAQESSLIMTVPLMLLSLAAFGAGYPIIQKQFIPITHPENLAWWAHPVILGFLVLGVVSAILIYRRAGAKDPVSIPAFANRLYIDDFYTWLVRWAQDGTASLLGWVDRWIIEGVGVQFTAKLTWSVGFALRFLQFGNIQAYVFFFGAGVVALIYFLFATT
jgi:NADH-quinone oxidoreductase subunit L